MQVILNTDPHVDGRHHMAEHLTKVVTDALHRFGEHITRVEAHIADENSHVKANPDEIQCTLEARLAGRIFQSGTEQEPMRTTGAASFWRAAMGLGKASV